jgi:hypothetical protein
MEKLNYRGRCCNRSIKKVDKYEKKIKKPHSNNRRFIYNNDAASPWIVAFEIEIEENTSHQNVVKPAMINFQNII